MASSDSDDDWFKRFERERAEKKRRASAMADAVEGSNTVHLRVGDGGIRHIVIHKSTKRGERPEDKPYQVSRFDEKMQPFGHRFVKDVRAGIHHVWDEHGPPEVVKHESFLLRTPLLIEAVEPPPSPGDYQEPGGHGSVEQKLQSSGHTYGGEKTMTARDAISAAGGRKGIPYLRDVHEIHSDPQHPDRDWPVYKKVVQYHDYLAKNPESVKNLPPVVVSDKATKDGAHRLSALSLLARTQGNHWLNAPVRVRTWHPPHD